MTAEATSNAAPAIPTVPERWWTRYPARMADWTPELRSAAAKEGWRRRRAAPTPADRLRVLLKASDPAPVPPGPVRPRRAAPASLPGHRPRRPTMHAQTALSPSDPAIVEVLAAHRRRTLRASIHPHLMTLCSTPDERAYLLRGGALVEALGPLPKAAWLDEGEQVRPVLDLAGLGLAWRPVGDAAALEAADLSPVGCWYAARHTAAGTCYMRHTQGYHDALATFLASGEGKDMPAAVGRVPCVLLYPDGRYTLAEDGCSLPVVLPLGGDAGLGDDLRAELDDHLQERTWPAPGCRRR